MSLFPLSTAEILYTLFSLFLKISFHLLPYEQTEDNLFELYHQHQHLM